MYSLQAVNEAFLMSTHNVCLHGDTLRKHAYSSIINFTTKKGEKSDENSYIFHNPAQNIDCGTR